MTYVIVVEPLGTVEFYGRPRHTHNEDTAAGGASIRTKGRRARPFVGHWRRFCNTHTSLELSIAYMRNQGIRI
jgi:hypothetical protein